MTKVSSYAMQLTDPQDLGPSYEMALEQHTENEELTATATLAHLEPAVATMTCLDKGPLGAITTFLAGGPGLEWHDPIIDQEGNRSRMETAFINKEKALAQEGKNLITLWPKSLKMDWEDEKTGERGTTYLSSTDPDIQELRKVYGSAKESGEKGKKLHDITKWPMMAGGVRGDLNSPAPLKQTTERLKSFTTFTPAHLEQTLAKASTPAQKLEILRKNHLAADFDHFFFTLLADRKKWYETQLAVYTKKESLDEALKRYPNEQTLLTRLANEPTDPAKQEALSKTVAHFDKISSKESLNRFALQWALTHPIAPSTDPSQISDSYKRNLEELKQTIQAEKGDRLPVSPISHLIPGGVRINQAFNEYKDRRITELQPSEVEFAEDVTSLSLAYPGDLDRERYIYRSTSPKIKKDSLELISLRLIKSIDAYQENPAASFADHPVIDNLLNNLSIGEQTYLKNQIYTFAREYKEIANDLKSIPEPITPQAFAQRFDEAKKKRIKTN